MNKVILIGRLTRDPEIRTSSGETQTTIASFTLAVNRPKQKDKEQEADFIRCVAFGKRAEFVEKYAKQGMKFVVEGNIHTGSYTNKDGQKVYTTDVNIESIEFAESKTTSSAPQTPAQQEGFFSDPLNDEGLPFM